MKSRTANVISTKTFLVAGDEMTTEGLQLVHEAKWLTGAGDHCKKNHLALLISA